MRVSLSFDERKPRERAIMHQFVSLAQQRTRRPLSPIPFCWLEQGTASALRLLERIVRWLVCAVLR